MFDGSQEQLTPAGTTRVRAACVADAPAMGVIHVAAWLATYRGIMSDASLDAMDASAYGERWAEILAANSETGAEGKQFFVFCDQPGDKPVGMASIAFSGQDALSGTANDSPPGVADAFGEMCMLNVHPDSWSAGAGRALLAVAESALRAAGSTRGFLHVAAANERATRFYARNGWAVQGDALTVTHSDKPISCLRMEKDL